MIDFIISIYYNCTLGFKSILFIIIMAKKKGIVREKIRLQSTESHYFYTTYKNKRNTEAKLEIKKHDPVIRKSVLFKEAKIKK